MREKFDIKLKKVITPKFRVSFPQVFKPKSFQGQEAKYSLVMLFDKKTDLTALKKAAMNAALEKYGSKDKIPKKFKWPFRNGDEKAEMMGYKGTIFVSASAKADKRPGLVDQSKSPITEEDASFYAGCYARAELLAFAYDTAGNIGVSFSLQNIQKLGDGTPFSGRKSAEEVFDAVEDESDVESNYDNGDEDTQENEMGF